MEVYHGTSNGYANFRCRCDLCKQAYSEWRKSRLDSYSLKHGTVTAYKYGCRCESCKEARANQFKELKEKAKADPSIIKKHGTSYAYVVLGCRCLSCYAWQAARDKKRRSS